MKDLPSKARLRELFDYTEKTYEKSGVMVTGGLTWKRRFDSRGRPNTREFGTPAGTIHPRTRRIQVAINGEDYELHRLIWCWHYGPTRSLVDHKDRDPTHNRVENLRRCNHSGNNANRTPQGGSSRYVGVYLNQRGKWIAQIKKDKKVTYLGSYDTEVEAARARDAATQRVHGEFGVMNDV